MPIKSAFLIFGGDFGGYFRGDFSKMHGIINLLTPYIYTAHFLYNISQGGRK